MPKLAETLSEIAESGPDALYNGDLSELLVEDIKTYGGIITLKDLANYKLVKKKKITLILFNNKLFIIFGD